MFKGDKTSRRDFIKLMAAATGGLVLTSCDSGGSDSVVSGSVPVVFPNGYRFVNLLETGDALPQGGGSISYLTGAVCLHDENEVIFQARNQDGDMGAFRAFFNPNAVKPRAESLEKVVQAGDLIGDRRIESFGPTVANREGTVAFVGKTVPASGEGVRLPFVYFGRRGESPTPRVSPLDPAPGGGRFDLIFRDLSLHHNDDLLLVAHHATQTGTKPTSCLFYLPGDGSSGNVLVSSGDLMPDADGVTTGIGLVELNDETNFVAQVFASSPGQVVAQGMTLKGSSIISGRASDPSTIQLRTAPPNIAVPSFVRSQTTFQPGTSIYGPRIGRDGDLGLIIHDEQEVLRLSFRGKDLLTASGPGDSLVRSLAPPVVGRNGLLYYAQATAATFELVVTDGNNSNILLSRGDQIQGRTVETILFGFQPKQVDAEGVMALVVEYNDGTAGVVLGLPV